MLTPKYVLLALWSAAAGALIPFMAVLNSRLGKQLGEPIHAAALLFAIGLTVVICASLILTGRLPDLKGIANASPFDFAGGLIVAFYVTSVTFLVPRFGVGNTILFVMTAPSTKALAGVDGATNSRRHAQQPVQLTAAPDRLPQFQNQPRQIRRLNATASL